MSFVETPFVSVMQLAFLSYFAGLLMIFYGYRRSRRPVHTVSGIVQKWGLGVGFSIHYTYVYADKENTAVSRVYGKEWKHSLYKGAAVPVYVDPEDPSRSDLLKTRLLEDSSVLAPMALGVFTIFTSWLALVLSH